MNALDALGNPVRRALLEHLRANPRHVEDLAAHFDVSRPAISRHLRVLEDAGLVEHAAAGRRNVYALRAEGFEAARAYLDAFWGETLARFKLVADNQEER